MAGIMKTIPFRPRGAAAAFTLVELLIVIAIVGILAGLLAAGISYATNSARRNECLNNLRQWGGALSLYLDDHRNRSFPTFGPAADEATAWYNVLPPYLEAGAVSVPFKDRTTYPFPGDGTKNPFICPSDDGAAAGSPDGTKPYSSYQMNRWVNAGKRLRDTQLKFPSAFVVMTETCNFSAGGADASTLAPAGSASAFRHNDSINLLFADGHAAHVHHSSVPADRDNGGGLQWNPNKDLNNQDL